jgi:integrase
MRMYCRKDQVDSDGLADIIFIVKEKKIVSGEKCSPKSWMQEGQMVSNKYNGALQVNTRLKQKSIVLAKIIEDQEEFDIDAIRRLFDNYLRNPGKFQIIKEVKSFSLLIDKILDDYRTQWSFSKKNIIKSLRSKILRMNPQFTIDMFSLSWWQSYVEHWNKNSHNTFHIDCKAIKGLVRVLRGMGYTIDKSIDEIRWSYIEPRIEPLTWDEVKLLAEVDLSDHKPRYEDSRYMWVLCAYLGQRWSDVKRANKSYFYQKKVNGRKRGTTPIVYRSLKI